jgi:hypothetical protein
MLNRNLNLQRYKVLFVTGNFSGILKRLHRRFTELEIRRGFTSQLMTISKKLTQSDKLEHNPMLYEDSTDGQVHLAGVEASGTRVRITALLTWVVEDHLFQHLAGECLPISTRFFMFSSIIPSSMCINAKKFLSP